MSVGGNKNAREFFEDEEENWDQMTIHQKYNSKAAALYREKISCLAENREWNYEEAKAKVNKSSSSNNHSMHHSKSASAISNSYQQESYQDTSYQNVNSQEFRDQRDNYFNGLQAQNSQRPDNVRPSEGGKYAGFGNTAAPPPRSQSEVFDTTLSSLSSGWSLLSLGASKVKDNALKYGSLATQKVVEVSQNVSEKVDLVLSFVPIGFLKINYLLFR